MKEKEYFTIPGKEGTYMKIPSKKEPIRVLTWKEAKPFIEVTMKRNKKFFEELAEL